MHTKISVGKHQWKRHLERYGYKFEDNINIFFAKKNKVWALFSELGCESLASHWSRNTARDTQCCGRF